MSQPIFPEFSASMAHGITIPTYLRAPRLGKSGQKRHHRKNPERNNEITKTQIEVIKSGFFFLLKCLFLSYVSLRCSD